MNLTTPKVSSFTPPARPQTSIFQLIFLVIVLAAFLWFITKPQFDSLSQKQAKLASLNEQQSSLSKRKQELDRLVTEMKAVSNTDNLKLIDEALPLDQRITKIHVLVDSLVKASGMTLANINADVSDSINVAGDKNILAKPFASQRKLKTITITTNITGSIGQFSGLLSLFENSSRIMDVEAIDITASEDTNLSFRLKIRSYFYAP